MGDVVELGIVTTQEIQPEKVLNAALSGNLKDCVVVGTKQDGSVYFAMSTSDAAEVNWLLDCAKYLLMNGMQVDTGEE